MAAAIWASLSLRFEQKKHEGRAAGGGEALDLKLLVLTLPHSNERQRVALRSEASKCLHAGLGEVWGRAPKAMVLDNAAEAGGRMRGTVVESRLFSQFRGHYRIETRLRDQYLHNKKGSMENAVGILRRNLLAPVPSLGSMAEPNAMLADGRARLCASSSRREVGAREGWRLASPTRHRSSCGRGAPATRGASTANPAHRPSEAIRHRRARLPAAASRRCTPALPGARRRLRR